VTKQSRTKKMPTYMVHDGS